jgi:di/tricarboxylate transporter
VSDGALILLIFGAGLVGFATERIRHDLVALLMLAASVLLGLVPAPEAFAGFGDPAVITVAAVMVLSAAVSRSGMLERLLRPLQPLLSREAGIGIVYALLAGAASSVMNNVGALALLLPAALASCRAAHVSPSRVLMPMAFASLLGGLVTMIGTPPNILLAQMRADLGDGSAFAMFDFARVGLPLAVVGIAMTLMLVRLLPVRAERDEQPLKFRIADYLFELRVSDDVSADLTVERLAATMPGDDRLEVHAIDRGGLLVTAPRASRRLLPGDIVQVEGRAPVVEQAMTRWGLLIAGEAEDDLLEGAFAEFVVTDGSPLTGNPAASAILAGQSVALVAVSRRGKAIAEALAAQAPQAGDVLLLQLAADRAPALAAAMGLLPLSDRPIRLGLAPRDMLPLLALLGAIAAAGAGLTSLGLALLLGVIVLALAGRLPARCLSRYRLAGDPAAGGPDSGGHGLWPEQHCWRPGRRPGQSGRRPTSMAVGGRGAGGDDGGDALPQQCRRRADHGTDRRQCRPGQWCAGGRHADGGGGRGVLRFPHPHRAPVQRAGVGAGWLSIR